VLEPGRLGAHLAIDELADGRHDRWRDWWRHGG